MMLRRLFVVLPLILVAAGFKETTMVRPQPDQPEEERAAQDALPQATNPLWAKLAKCTVKFNQRTGLFSIGLTSDVKGLDGQSIDVNGFMLPLDGSDETRHFLLTKRTPVCLFCPPGEPNEVIEVTSTKPVAWIDDLVTMKGRFKLVNKGEKGVFFALTDASTTR
jgi:hypothetical protein